jgi:ribonuclease BN (tRNA processing enzyme)
VIRSFGIAATLVMAGGAGQVSSHAPVPAALQAPNTLEPSWVTLGTMGGPMPFAGRSQPANALIWAGRAWLIDCGDGAVGQLAKAGLTPRAVNVLILSHLHFDHTGGVAALIGLRYQISAPGRLRIYGPPGTRELIDGIIASMRPAARAGYGLPGEPNIDPADTVSVRELADGETFVIDGVTVSAAQNTHYSFIAGSAQDRAFKSFSYRFEVPGRSIVYTGDTGPSPAVERLSKGSDLLVTEMIDVKATVAAIARLAPEQTGLQLEAMRQHLTRHHLSPEQVGDMAARMKTRRVVVTHLAGPTGMTDRTSQYAATVAARAHVRVDIARDLDRF